MKKIQLQARKAKEAGYQYVSSVIKSCYRTTYYNILPVDTVIATGWQAAPRCIHFFKKGGSAMIRVGCSRRPEKCISRTVMMQL